MESNIYIEREREKDITVIYMEGLNGYIHVRTKRSYPWKDYMSFTWQDNNLKKYIMS